MSKGRVWKYGDDVNTDVIFPGRFTYQIMEPAEMAKHALEDLDPGFAKNVKPGDVIVAGKNFGCGSSREQAAACLRAAGVQAVIAKSFARIYFRNAINLGLAVLLALATRWRCSTPLLFTAAAATYPFYLVHAPIQKYTQTIAAHYGFSSLPVLLVVSLLFSIGGAALLIWAVARVQRLMVGKGPPSLEPNGRPLTS